MEKNPISFEEKVQRRKNKNKEILTESMIDTYLKLKNRKDAQEEKLNKQDLENLRNYYQAMKLYSAIATKYASIIYHDVENYIGNVSLMANRDIRKTFSGFYETQIPEESYEKISQAR